MTQEFVTLPRKVVKNAISALEGTETSVYRYQYEFEVSASIKALREALEQVQGEKAHHREHMLKDVRCECCGYMTHHREHMGCIRVAQPRQVPLTDAQLDEIESEVLMRGGDYSDVFRAIERAHNINHEGEEA